MSETIVDIRKDFLDGWSKWEGTPFDYRCCECQKGTDCIRGMIQEAKEVGVIRKGYSPPNFPPDWFEFVPSHYSKYAFHDELLKFTFEIPENEIIPGDIVGFSTKGIECHVGVIYPGDRFLHTKPYGKVCYQRLRNYPNITGYYRIKGF